MALADLKSGKFKFSREAAGVSLNPPKFVHTLSIRIYQSNQCTKIAMLRNVLLMWVTAKAPGEAFLRHDLIERYIEPAEEGLYH